MEQTLRLSRLKNPKPPLKRLPLSRGFSPRDQVITHNSSPWGVSHLFPQPPIAALHPDWADGGRSRAHSWQRREADVGKVVRCSWVCEAAAMDCPRKST